MTAKPDPLSAPPSRLRRGFVHAGLWGLIFGVIGAGLALLVLADAPDGAPTGLGMAASLVARFAMFGVLCGALFGWASGLLFDAERFARTGRVPVILGGAFGTALFVPLFLQTMNLLSGDGLVAWRLVLDDSVWAFFFGGIAALASLELARRRAEPTRIAADAPEVE